MTEVSVLDRGWVVLLEWMGDDASIARAARTSLNKSEGTTEKDRRLIHRLWKDQHTSPFEMVEFKFHVKAPLFVARQWMRHRTGSYNEWSGRYSVINEEVYIPDLDRMRGQASGNHQMSGDLLPENMALECQRLIQIQSSHAFEVYHQMLNHGLSREMARLVLPLNTYTIFIYKVDLHNLLKFIRLRSAPDAQWEIQQYSNAMKELISPIVPATIEAFETY